MSWRDRAIPESPSGSSWKSRAIKENGAELVDSGPAPRKGNTFTRGFMGKEEQAGYFNPLNWAEELGQNALPLVAGTMAAETGPAGMAAAASAARGVQSGIQGKGAGAIAKDAAVEGAATYTAAKYVAPLASKALEGGLSLAGKAGNAILRYLAKNTAGVSASSVEALDTLGPKVGRYIGASPEEADKIAAGIRKSITDEIKNTKAEYPRIIEKIKSDPDLANAKFDLQKELGNDVLKIADDFQYFKSPNMQANPEATKFWKFAGQVDNLKQATVGEVYEFQKQLNSLSKQYAGKPLGAAFNALKNTVRGFLGTSVPEIGEANAKYAAAKSLEAETKGILNSNDLIGHIVKTYKNPLSTGAKETLEEAASRVPGVGEGIAEARAYKAGQEFSPLLRPLPQTGMGATIMKGLGFGASAGVGGLALHDPVLAGAGAGVGAALGVITSPRASYLAIRASQAIPDAASGLATKYGARLAPIYGQTMEDAYRRLGTIHP